MIKPHLSQSNDIMFCHLRPFTLCFVLLEQFCSKSEEYDNIECNILDPYSDHSASAFLFRILDLPHNWPEYSLMRTMSIERNGGRGRGVALYCTYCTYARTVLTYRIDLSYTYCTYIPYSFSPSRILNPDTVYVDASQLQAHRLHSLLM